MEIVIAGPNGMLLRVWICPWCAPPLTRSSPAHLQAYRCLSLVWSEYECRTQITGPPASRRPSNGKPRGGTQSRDSGSRPKKKMWVVFLQRQLHHGRRFVRRVDA